MVDEARKIVEERNAAEVAKHRHAERRREALHLALQFASQHPGRVYDITDLLSGAQRIEAHLATDQDDATDPTS